MLSSTLSSLVDFFSSNKPWTSSPLGDMLRQNWYPGLTSFGGPAVHFQIVRVEAVDANHGLAC